MKKFITTLLITFIAITSIFANTGKIEINSSIAEISLSTNLSYEGIHEYDDASSLIIIRDRYSLSQPESRTTDNFVISTSGNTLSGKSINISIEATNFIKGSFDSNIEVTPNVKETAGFNFFINNSSYNVQIPANYYNNVSIFTFDLGWVGREDLPAGEYISTITVNYSNQN